MTARLLAAFLLLTATLPSAVTAQTPELSPGGITAAQAALENACHRRGSIPEAQPATESEAIAATSRARIDGASLKVGRFTYPAAPKDSEEYGYSYVGRYAAAPVDILIVTDFDSSGWAIGDQETGQKLEMPQLPIPSPDGRYWAVNHAFPAPDGKVTIYERTAKAWRQVAVFKIEDACDLRWTGSATLSLRDNTGLPFMHGQGPERRIVQQDGTWRLVP